MEPASGFRCHVVLALLAALLRPHAVTSDKQQGCHHYAGGHVYPGEAFRVPVSDHSLHLSKAKSEWGARAGGCLAGALCERARALIWM